MADPFELAKMVIKTVERMLSRNEPLLPSRIHAPFPYAKELLKWVLEGRFAILDAECGKSDTRDKETADGLVDAVRFLGIDIPIVYEYAEAMENWEEAHLKEDQIPPPSEN